MRKNSRKIAVIGAGNVGASIAYVMSIKNTCRELVLIDVDRKKAEGEAMDINHGLPFLDPIDIYAGDFSDIKDCDIIVMAAGAGRRPGETRLDLASKNVQIAKSVTEKIKQYYNGGIVLVVANPVDVLTYHITRWLDLPKGKVVGSGTVLDGVRLRTLLGRKFNIDLKNIHAYILGEHGDSQFPSWSFSKIAGFTIDEYIAKVGIPFPEEEREMLALKTKTAGAEIIKRKGATFYGIAVATNALCESIIQDENTIRTVGSVLNGEYGIHDVVLNVPSIIGDSGVEKILEVDLPEDELNKLRQSAENVRAVIEATKNI